MSLLTQTSNDRTESVLPKLEITKSWRDKNRLYPPFRQQKNDIIFLQKYDPGNDMVEHSSVRKPSKFRPSVCIRKNQFPIACTNIPFVCDENTVEFGERVPSHSSHRSGASNEISTICGLRDAPCIKPICGHGQDDEPCNITLGFDSTDNVCQEPVSVLEHKSDDVSLLGDKRESQCHVIECGESVDYVICEGIEKGIFTSSEDLTSYEELGEKYHSIIRDVEYESSGSTSEKESKLEFISESKLFQDPLISHRLMIPYKEIPRSRYHVGGWINDSSKTKFLAKRPRSPVREIPEGQFDVDAGISEVMKRSEIHNAKYALRKSKEWMDKRIISDSTSSPMLGTSTELLTIFLKVLLDDVRLSPTVGESENGLSLTLATIWAMNDFVITETGSKMTQSITISKLGMLPILKSTSSHNLMQLKSTSIQQISDTCYPPRGSDNRFLHQALPWVHLCAAHAEGLPQKYANIRTCIDQVTPDNELEKPRYAYVPDMSCAHCDEIMQSKSVSNEDLLEAVNRTG